LFAAGEFLYLERLARIQVTHLELRLHKSHHIADRSLTRIGYTTHHMAMMTSKTHIVNINRRQTRAAFFLLLCLSALTRTQAQSSSYKNSINTPITIALDVHHVYPQKELKAGEETLFEINPEVCRENGRHVLFKFLTVEIWAEGLQHAETHIATQAGGTTPQGDNANKADPMLSLRHLAEPVVMYDSKSRWTLRGNTTADLESYQLLSPYHRVTTQLRDGKYYAKVTNVDKWMKGSFKYFIRAECNEEPPCPSPTLKHHPQDSPANPSKIRDEYEPLQCAGKGTCKQPVNFVTRASDRGQCECENGYGGVGCEVKTTTLVREEWTRSNAAIAEWKYYSITINPLEGRSQSLLVEMSRRRGDPVLFVKHADDGFLMGGLPTVFDYREFADTNSFRSRLNYHYRLLENVRAGKYYIAVFNNDVYIQEDADFSVRVISATTRLPNSIGSGTGLCPAQCHAFEDPPQGRCDMTGFGKDQCVCNQGFGGPMCEGMETTVELGRSVEAIIAPARWLYFKINIEAKGKSGSISRPLQVILRKEGGHPVLLARREEYPTLLKNDFIFTMSQHLDPETTFQVKPSDIVPGLYIFAVYNMDYYEHESSHVKVSVEMAKDSYLEVNPFMSIILGVISSMFLCLFMSVCKKLFYRHSRMGADNPEASALQTVLANVGMGAAGVGLGGERQRQGLTTEEIDAIPEKLFSESMCPKEDAHCAVCLGEYEVGESVKELPCDAKHVFHKECITQWLQTSTLCPLCRMDISPDRRNSQPSTAAAGDDNGVGAASDGEMRVEIQLDEQNPASQAEVTENSRTHNVVSQPLTPQRGRNGPSTALVASPPRTPPGTIEDDAP